MSVAVRDSIPERKEVTERIERMKQEQAERDQQLRKQQSPEQQQRASDNRQEA
jgi:uncharacterized protein YaiL (DUF2058 family)